MQKILLFVSLACLSVFSVSVISAPWVKTDDRYLRSSINVLADGGFLNIPVNTYPIMWQPIANELVKIDTLSMTPLQLLAYLRLNAALNFARKDQVERVSVNASSDELSVAGFGQQYRQRAQLSLSTEMQGKNWAFGIQNNLNHAIFSDKQYTQTNDFDGSYAAYMLGNWVLSASRQAQWWGPGYDTSFNYDHSGRPAKVLQIKRLNSALPLWGDTSALGALDVSVQYAEQAGSDIMRHHKSSAARVAIKPWQRLELSASYRHHQTLQQAALNNLVLPSAADVTAQNIINLDARYSVNDHFAVYSEISTASSDTGYMAGAQYTLGNTDNLFSINAEYQQQPSDYPYWLIMGSGTADNIPSSQWLLAMQWYKSSGDAGYMHLKQQRFTQSSMLTLSSQLQVGYQSEVLSGLLRVDYQLRRDETVTADVNFEHSAAVNWEWRW